MATDLLDYLTDPENASELLIGDEMDLVSKILLKHLLQRLPCLWECNESRLAVVI
jgi:hypothetical protein